MRQNLAEILHLPNMRSLRAGALALGAAFSLQPGHLQDAGEPAPVQSGVPVLTAELAAGGADAPQSQPIAGDLGQPEEAQLEQNLPPLIKRYVDRNTVVISALRCSGALIRNAQNVPIGALTAAHCVNESPTVPLYKGGDGKKYMVSAEPITPATGVDVVNLQPVANVQEFVIPPRDSVNDQALAVFPGHSPKEVISSYRRQQLPPSAVNTLKSNKTKIWLSGFPYTQTGDSAGNMIRQVFPTTFIGEETVFADNNIFEVASATDKLDSNGALCSWGISGGQGLVERLRRLPDGSTQRVVRSVGNFSAFALFKALNEKGGSHKSWSRDDARAAAEDYRRNFPHIRWKGVDGVCSYSFGAINRAYQVVRVVPDLSSVPAPAKKVTSG